MVRIFIGNERFFLLFKWFLLEEKKLDLFSTCRLIFKNHYIIVKRFIKKRIFSILHGTKY